MLYIVTHNNERTWHVGRPLPKITDVSTLTEIQADGNELRHIKENFDNLIMPSSEVCVWYGDLARTIYLNLPKG